MAAKQTYLAVDLGASSGRVLAGRFDGHALQLDEVHRFPNGPVSVGGRLYWDILQIGTQIQDGLRSAAQTYGPSIASIGLDTWGVDFALLDRNDELLSNPSHYRDSQTHGAVAGLSAELREEITSETGIQFMDFNTLFQLAAMRRRQSPVLDMARSFLMIPDYLNWLLTGVKGNEYTDATTTQFFNSRTGEWSRRLLEHFQVPTDMLQTIIQPGTDLGPLRSEVARDTGLSGVRVIAPGTHDTASAVVAVPAVSSSSAAPDWCYISSGTWSLMGAEVGLPIINDASRRHNFTNEGGVGGTIRLLKNITGLWLIQECRRCWAHAGHDYSWEQLMFLAQEAEPLRGLVNPDDPCFLAPSDMPQTIAEYCRRTGQTVPDSPGAVIRCALESLALRYRMVLESLQELTGGVIRTIHVVGGGSQNRQLCQMTADACDRRVLAGPVEATAIGNVLVQAIARGELASIAEARQMLAAGFPLVSYQPHDPAPWDNAYARFLRLFE